MHLFTILKLKNDLVVFEACCLNDTVRFDLHTFRFDFFGGPLAEVFRENAAHVALFGEHLNDFEPIGFG